MFGALKVKVRPSNASAYTQRGTIHYCLKVSRWKACATDMSSHFGMNGLRNIINVRSECLVGSKAAIYFAARHKPNTFQK